MRFRTYKADYWLDGVGHFSLAWNPVNRRLSFCFWRRVVEVIFK